jgi:hypothetical protein
VHHQNPDVVGFGWLRAMLSTNGGKTWRALGGDWTNANRWDYQNSHMHEDVHALYFEPGFTDRRLYVLSDGGIVQTADWGEHPGVFKSAMNRNLANLQFYSPASSREFWGTLGIGKQRAVVAGGLQDNGNVWCQLRPQPEYWRKIDGGDGGWAAFVTGERKVPIFGGTEHLVSNTMGQAVGHAIWKAAEFSGVGTIDLMAPATGALDSRGLKGPIADVVPTPSWKIASDALMLAVGAAPKLPANVLVSPGSFGSSDAEIDSRVVFGLFGESLNDTLRWQEIGRLPANAGGISALGTDTGESVYVGTFDGRMFVIDSATTTVLELAVDPPLGAIGRIVVHRQRGPFALMATGQVATGQVSRVLKLNTFRWSEIPSTLPLPQELCYGLDIYRGGGPIGLAVATDSAVWVSPDDGITWFRSTTGLPRVPHGADLRFGTLDERPTLFLGTFARSVWMVDIEDLWELRERRTIDQRPKKFIPRPSRRENDAVSHRPD